MPQAEKEITAILKDWTNGKRESADELLKLVYDELRKIAARYLGKERSGHTLQPTALVHEAYMRLIDISDLDWKDRAHFFAVAANVMRHILVDHARARLTEKRGGHFQRISLETAVNVLSEPSLDVLAVDDAMRELAEFDKRQCKIIELRFFGGLTIEETAAVLDISAATVKREWILAKAWLFRRLNQ